jgi:cysteine-rich secretory family protein
MKQLSLIIAAFFLITSFKADKVITIDKTEAQKAFALLLKIRANPALYSKQFHFNKDIHVSKTKLVWNDTLAQVAEAKAYDMANRDYFGHTDPDGYGINYFINKSGYTLDPNWLKNKADNFFESIAANNVNGEAAIRALIIDQGQASLGHRNHLLGLDKWNASLTDIGIGFAECPSGSSFQTYTCVIIAKHNY